MDNNNLFISGDVFWGLDISLWKIYLFIDGVMWSVVFFYNESIGIIFWVMDIWFIFVNFIWEGILYKCGEKIYVNYLYVLMWKI